MKKGSGRKKRILKHAERRSRSKEDRVERDAKKRRNSKAESMSAGSIFPTLSVLDAGRQTDLNALSSSSSPKLVGLHSAIGCARPRSKRRLSGRQHAQR